MRGLTRAQCRVPVEPDLDCRIKSDNDILWWRFSAEMQSEVRSD